MFKGFEESRGKDVCVDEFRLREENVLGPISLRRASFE